jgi:N-acetylmuramoyl-L-alanine amidase
MLWGVKHFHKIFASASLGFVLASLTALPCPAAAAPNSSSTAKRESAAVQFARAEELRQALNDKPADTRTLAEYKKVVAGYQRVYLITPHAVEVPDSLEAVAELNTEMGDHFGRSYYQSAADTYAFLIHEYPTGKHAQDAMLRLGKLQKDQLGDPTSATKTLLDYQKKYPHSTHKREVQEALAELALTRSMETGVFTSHEFRAPAAPVPPPTEVAVVATPQSGGEPAKSIAVPHLQKIRTNLTPDSAEVIIDLEDSVQYTSGRIANPDRIYFDLHKARLSPAAAHDAIHVSGDLLTGVRVAQNHTGVVRVVLDVNGVKDYAVSLSKKPTRLIIEIYSSATHAASPVETAANTNSAGHTVTPTGNLTKAPAETLDEVATNGSPKVQASNPVAASVVPVEKPDPAPRNASLVAASPKANAKPDLVQPVVTPRPTRDGQSTLTRALGLKISRIVIDAGHGGHDTGTVGPTGLMEKDLCLDVALRLGKLIQQKLPGADIVYTRSDDTFIPLEERTHIANDAKADLFVSIHANSSPDHGARGVETYYLNLKGSAEAMEVAARENTGSDHGIHDLEDMVKQITRTEKLDESRELAEDVQDSLSRRIQRQAATVRNRGVRQAPFVVLIGADMPSILTEISFLSNPSDEQLLKKPDYRQHVAEGVYAGVAAYLQNMNSVALNGTVRAPKTPAVNKVEQSRNQK